MCLPLPEDGVVPADELLECLQRAAVDGSILDPSEVARRAQQQQAGALLVRCAAVE